MTRTISMRIKAIKVIQVDLLGSAWGFVHRWRMGRDGATLGAEGFGEMARIGL